MIDKNYSTYLLCLMIVAFTVIGCAAPESVSRDIAVPFESCDTDIRKRAFQPPIALSGKELAERALMQLPDEVIAGFLDDSPIVIDGQMLHPKLQWEFQQRAKQRSQSAINYHEWLAKAWNAKGGKEKLRKAVDHNWVKSALNIGGVDSREVHIPGPNGPIRAKIYSPHSKGETIRPALLYLHGGAWIMASVEAVEPQAKILAREADMIVVSIDYHLAPEHPFPAAHLDALAAYNWLVDNAENLGSSQQMLGVGGDSAGGNMSIVVANEQVRNGGIVPKALLLYYPFTDSAVENYMSYDLFGDGFGLDKHFIKTVTTMILADKKDKEHDWLKLPRSIDYARQPPTLVATAGFDPIRDHGIEHEQKLKAAGVETIARHYSSLNHGFLENSGTINDAYIACIETARLFSRLIRR